MASSDIIVFLDADVYLGDTWGSHISTVIERLRHDPHLITGSIYGISDEKNWIERLWFAPRVRLEKVKYLNGGHMILTKVLFLRIGGFDPELETGEDYEFCARGRQLLARIENFPDLHVIHAGYPRTLGRFFGRERWHARGDCKSVKTLISSKPGLVGVLNLVTAALCVLGAILGPGFWMSAGIYLIFLLSVSVAAAVKRCRGRVDPSLLVVAFLYIAYFTARTLSIADVALERLGNGRGTNA